MARIARVWHGGNLPLRRIVGRLGRTGAAAAEDANGRDRNYRDTVRGQRKACSWHADRRSHAAYGGEKSRSVAGTIEGAAERSRIVGTDRKGVCRGSATAAGNLLL